MKPLKLTMRAFGSYVTPGTIDFERTEQNLFLITGDTGAGKTTIFDAIVFALYGEASSGMNKKNGNELQSQYADPQISPFVELTFSEGDGISRQIYTVRRTPRHIRPVKRGHGTTEEKETVSLILPDQTVCQHIDIIDKTADDTYPCNIKQISLYGFQCNRKMLSLQLTKDTFRCLQSGFNTFNRVMVTLQGKLLV